MGKPSKLGNFSILIVEDDPALRDALDFEFTHFLGWRVLTASGVGPALEIAATQGVDVVLSDYIMPDGTGADLVRQIEAAGLSHIPVILMTGLLAEDLRDCGATATISKPFDVDRLADLLASQPESFRKAAGF